jgi:hypothetical protein
MLNGSSAFAQGNVSMDICETFSTSFIQNNVSCYEGNDGSVAVVAIGGLPPYSYSWESGGNSPILSNLGAGIYVVTVYLMQMVV